MGAPRVMGAPARETGVPGRGGEMAAITAAAGPVLDALAAWPLLTRGEAAAIAGVGVRQAARHLRALAAVGQAERIDAPDEVEALYCLTGPGVAAAARRAGVEPGDLSTRFGLGEAAVLARVPALRRVRAARAALLALGAALAAAGGRLGATRSGPLRWRYTLGSRRLHLDLDGEGTIEHGGRSWRVAILCDDGETPPALLRGRLATLAAFRGPDRAGAAPLVLLVAADAHRAALIAAPRLLWTTADEWAARGPLGASWRAAGGVGARPLLDALDALAPRGYIGPAPAPPPARLGASYPCALAARAAAARRSPGPCGGPSLLPLALPDGCYDVLFAAGRHPRLAAGDLALAAGRPRAPWAVPALAARGLLITERDDGRRAGRRGRPATLYTLSGAGLRLLARRAGAAMPAYRDACGLLATTSGGADVRLTYQRLFSPHTRGIQMMHLALEREARARGGVVVWRQEWDGQPGRPRLGHPYQDAELLYRDDDGVLHARLEVDRGRAKLRKMRGKLRLYYQDRARPDPGPATLLVVTTGWRRAAHLLDLNARLARAYGIPPLDLRATTFAALEGDGPLAPIWRDVTGPCDPRAPGP